MHFDFGARDKGRLMAETKEEIDCWNPNCGNKAESEDSVTCDDCTSAQESTGAGICETCTCWVDEAYFDQDSTPYCADCYEDVPKESRWFEAKSERGEGETHG